MKRFTSALLALLMMVSIIPVAVSAETAPIVIDPNTAAIEGSLLEAEEVVYQVTLSGTGSLNVAVMGYSDGQVSIYPQGTDTLLENFSFYGDEAQPDTNMCNAILTAGTYLIKVSAVFFGDEGRYRLSTQFTPYAVNEIEPNIYDTAMPVAEKQVVTGAITLGDELDFFVINVPSKLSVEFTLKSYFNCSAYIYSKDLYKTYASLYTSGTLEQPATDKGTVILTKGTYYIKVDSSSTGMYQLSYKTKLIAPTFKNAKFKNKKKKAILKWSKVAGAKGYEVFRSKKSSTKGFKKIKTLKKTKLTTAMAPLYKRYYFKVRAYKTVNGKKVYSDFCDVFYIYTYRK